jgi:hypothetical protein
MIKTLIALVLATTIAAFTAVISSLDAVSHTRDKKAPAAAPAATHDMSTETVPSTGSWATTG